MESVFSAILGVVCILIGISNRKGNINSLHAYHRKRVSEEDRLPFGKLAGLGMILVGITLIMAGGLEFAAEFLQNGIYSTLRTVVLIVGLTAGLGTSIYAICKYNKGLF